MMVVRLVPHEGVVQPVYPFPKDRPVVDANVELDRQRDEAQRHSNTYKRSFVMVPRNGAWSDWVKIGQCEKWSQTLPNESDFQLQVEYVLSTGRRTTVDVRCNVADFDRKLSFQDGRIVNWIRYRWANVAKDKPSGGEVFGINTTRAQGFPEPELERPK
ncbi:MAG: hypothetical protein KatS3mg082_3166 [Nitrospiraceae bacterium]|nr:MAG: hypothetical protein KatS3mg082_3166 [Nitrospiraceae bacterium]